MNEVIPVLSDAAITILTALLALLSAYAVRWINTATAKARTETQALEDDQFRALANEALDRANDLAAKTVTQIEQTTAGALRELVKSGAVKREELEELGRRAVEEVVDSLSPVYQEAIVDTSGDLEQYVTKLVESKVYELKHGVTIPASAIETVG